MAKRQSVSTGSPYEPILGIARAVRIGNIAAVAGTAPIAPDGSNAAVGDPVGQARRCFEIAKDALEGLGASLEDVIRTRVILTDIAHWEAVGKVHGEYFGDIRPVNTMMQVTRFIDPEWLVEIEVDAVISE